MKTVSVPSTLELIRKTQKEAAMRALSTDEQELIQLYRRLPDLDKMSLKNQARQWGDILKKHLKRK